MNHNNIKIPNELQKLVDADTEVYLDDYEAILDRIIILDKPCCIKELLSDDLNNKSKCDIPRSVGSKKVEDLCDLGIIHKFRAADGKVVYCKPGASEKESY